MAETLTERGEDLNLKRDMLEALSTVQDPGQRIVLMLLLRSMDNISSKLDRVLSDEAKIKHIVLNGYSDQHDAHHRFIEEQLAKKEDSVSVVNFVKQRNALGGYCDYASRKLEEEKDIKISKRKIGEGVLEKLIAAALIFIAGVVSSNWF